jgi:hypothetical protein
MSNENEQNQEAMMPKMSSQEHLQKKVIDFAFSSCLRGCTKEEDVAEYTNQTGFVRSVMFLEPMTWKYLPDQIRTEIKNIHKELKKESKAIEDDKELSDDNKRLSKRKKEDEAAIRILQYCLIALQYSPINVELKEVELFEGYDELIKDIRSDNQIRLFSDVDKV